MAEGPISEPRGQHNQSLVPDGGAEDADDTDGGRSTAEADPSTEADLEAATSATDDSAGESSTDADRESAEAAGSGDAGADPPAVEKVDLGVYEWGGGIAAGLGFFLTPIFTAPVACYCAMRIRREKPVSMYIILAIVVSTIVFWWIIIWSVAL